MTDLVRTLTERWRADRGETYQMWFLWPKHLKNFYSVRRGIDAVVNKVQAGTFGNAYRRSPLETVVSSIAEQRQIFKGADHAFLWGPKLHTLDIYGNAGHQRAFVRLLHTCNCCDAEQELVQAIQQLNRHGIKGLGSAIANLLCSIRPTLAIPFSTAIVNGYNTLTGSRVKFGKWNHYLAMHGDVLSLNGRYRDLPFNDLGTVAGLLFDIGMERYPAPPREGDAAMIAGRGSSLAKARKEAASFAKRLQAGRTDDASHIEAQGWLRDLDKALGFAVWVATSDRSHPHNGGVLSNDYLATLLNSLLVAGADTVPLIGVVWLNVASLEVGTVFEVEHATSIYSGIVRLLDLILNTERPAKKHLFLAVPSGREADVRAQLARPAFSRVSELGIRYVPYTSLTEHREAMARFGVGIKPIKAIAKTL